MPISASTMNVPRHDVSRSTWPPMTGAITGARPLTSISSDMNRAMASPENRSRATAVATTKPAATPKAWTSRSPASAYADGASAQSSENAMYTVRPMSSGLRRPNESDSGPTNSWPSARPTMNVVNDSWTCDALAPSSPAMPGNAGRYMSTDSGPSAHSAPSSPTSLIRLGPTPTAAIDVPQKFCEPKFRNGKTRAVPCCWQRHRTGGYSSMSRARAARSSRGMFQPSTPTRRPSWW